MAWIELHQTLPSHRKIKKLKRILKIKTPQAVGHLVMLWLWAIDNAPDGGLSKIDPDDIAEACEWPKDGKVFIEALAEAEFLDDNMQLHDWDEYAGRLIEYQEEYRRKNRERQARFRERKRAERYANVSDTAEAEPVDRDGNVGVTRDKSVSNVTVTPLPNLTLPNQLYSTHHPRACAREGTGDDTAESAPPGPENAPELSKVMTFYMNRVNPTPSRQSLAELTAYAEDIDADVIIQAMEYAIDEHKATWSYIRATLRAYVNRGIKTMDDLRRANEEHERAKQRQEDTRNARNTNGRNRDRGGGNPPPDTDPLRGFHTEP